MAKKHIIMEKAMEIFAEQGIESTSIQQITDRSGISKGAFYLYFKSKDELITSLIDYFMGNIVAEIEQSVSNNKKTDELLYKYLKYS
ncbi:TetR/AcrR family transcriptional regulator [Bacillus andreraoultii]|uniref:TetR/AcrR family transcriptional regulator n=1 Tax=Bacillus andreraoultii TaxID=1499685 RepID=UPI00053ABCB5|nr:TetR/AcrR family transcriptional regulator [Bacillus andreraoultii]